MMKDIDTVGKVSFLSCVTCKAGCSMPEVHPNVVQADIDRGLDPDLLMWDGEERILRRRPCGGCIALNDSTGCQLSAGVRPLTCLVCPMHIDSAGYVVSDVHCPDSLRIAQGILQKDPQICAYVAASARLMLTDKEFCKRSARFVDKYKCKIVLGHVIELAKLSE